MKQIAVTKNKNKQKILLITLLLFFVGHFYFDASSDHNIRIEVAAASNLNKKINKTKSTVNVDKKPINNPIPTMKIEELSDPPSTSLIEDPISLTAIEAWNPNLWKQGGIPLTGEISLNHNYIENLYLEFSDELIISVDNTELEGNNFRYFLENEQYNAFIYQSDQYQFFINLIDGPLEGTRVVLQIKDS